jgi:hypothetical protein
MARFFGVPLRNALGLGLGGIISMLGAPKRDDIVGNLELEDGANLLLEDGGFIVLE